jgi:transposase-like protein
MAASAAGSTRVDVKDRRVFPESEKRRIVAEYRAAPVSQKGEVLRREGVFQSNVWNWGNQIDDGTLGTKRRGPAPTGKDPAKVRVRELEEQLERAKGKIVSLEELVTAQGKCLALHVEVRIDDSATSRWK